MYSISVHTDLSDTLAHTFIMLENSTTGYSKAFGLYGDVSNGLWPVMYRGSARLVEEGEATIGAAKYHSAKIEITETQFINAINYIDSARVAVANGQLSYSFFNLFDDAINCAGFVDRVLANAGVDHSTIWLHPNETIPSIGTSWYQITESFRVAFNSGGVGVDHLYGGDGNDVLTGSNGNDELFGDAGTDNLSGGDGNDTLDGGLGNDTLNGGTGNNWLKGWVDADTLTTSGKSVLQGGDGVDNVSATAYSLLAGGSGNDILTGFGVIAGQAGNDTMTVSGNNSTVLFNFGTDGADILSIGAGVSGTKFSLSGVDVADLTLKRVGTSDNLFIGMEGSTDGLQINGVLSEGTLALGAQIWRELNGERSGDSFDFSGVVSDFIASTSYSDGTTLDATQLFIDNTTTPEHLNSSSAIAGGLLAAGYVADNGSFGGVSIGDSFDYINAGVQLMGVTPPTHFDGWLL